MLSKSRNDKILAAWGKGDDPNTPVIRALDPGYQALDDETIDSDTDRTWGQIDDWAYRVDGQRPFVQQELEHADIREAESGLFNTSGVRAALLARAGRSRPCRQIPPVQADSGALLLIRILH